MVIDASVDFRKDTPDYPEKDPDTHSPTLKRYHKALWSKPLPNGRPIDLEVRGKYLYHHSPEIGKLWLSSDAAIPTFTRWGFAKQHPELCADQDNQSFMAKAYTIGAMIVFPATKVGSKPTINGARGMNRHLIADRFDLTLECIRRHYIGLDDPSRLGETLKRYSAFFALFESFSGYVDFFLLHLVTDEYSTVKFCMPFDDFKTPAAPNDFHTYVEYRRRSIEFIEARNKGLNDTRHHKARTRSDR